MFCKNCGAALDDNADFCPKCGVAVNQDKLANDQQKTATNTIAIVGFVLSFFIGLAGLICSIIGLNKAPQYNGKGKGLAIAGIVISCLSMILSLSLFAN